MSDDFLDDATQAAVRELADDLSGSLSEAIDSAATRALERIEQELEARLGQIESATARVTDLFGTISDEIRTRAATALADGIRSEVLPVLVQAGQQAGVRHAQQISESFAAIEKGLQTLVAERSASVTATAERHAKDLRAHLEKVVTTAIEAATKRVLQRSEGAEQASLKALAEATRGTREETRKAAETVSAVVAAGTGDIKQHLVTVSAQIEEAQDETNAHVARIASELRTQHEAADSYLRNVVALHERRMRQMFYSQLGLGVIALVTLILLIARVG